MLRLIAAVDSYQLSSSHPPLSAAILPSSTAVILPSSTHHVASFGISRVSREVESNRGHIHHPSRSRGPIYNTWSADGVTPCPRRDGRIESWSAVCFLSTLPPTQREQSSGG
ncbi:uncharacterized protein PV07_11969 [Cladophialophora immunda]|uniref:Uncharacterized protein n=1 Tax=Cladophialophora immunda TaxID=569365 RepID=A0A0D1Z817_9EURO|nr:uncharacterized protein PV07_11969 [Cladophialophora immunda]KIW23796.1 hypothetical protein PV07_11969 [Cladophialophora immunda]